MRHKPKKVLTMAKEYIERKRAIVDACNSLELYPSEYAELENALNRIPAADVVPVVRCQDCVYARPLKDMNYDYLCRYWNGHSCNQNQFCSQGKRKEDEK